METQPSGKTPPRRCSLETCTLNDRDTRKDQDGNPFPRLMLLKVHF